MNLLIYLLSASHAVSASLVDKTVCGQIIQAQGRVEIVKLTPNAAGVFESRVFEMGMPNKVSCDEAVATGQNSGATLDIGNGKVVLGPATRFEVGPTNDGGDKKAKAMQLLYGQLRASITKKAAENKPSVQRVEIKTPTAVSGVRGTDFYVSYKTENEVSTTATLEGEVEVSRDANSSPVVVKPGQQTTILTVPEGQTPPEPKVEDLSLENRLQIREISKLVDNVPEFSSTSAKKYLQPLSEQEKIAAEFIKEEEAKKAALINPVPSPEGQPLELAKPNHRMTLAGQMGFETETQGFVLEYQWLEIKRRPFIWLGKHSLLNIGETNEAKKLDLTNLGVGITFYARERWSIYARGGGSLLEDDTKDRFVALVMGLGARNRTPLWKRWALAYGTEVLAAQSLFKLDSRHDQPNVFSFLFKVGLEYHF